MLWPAAVCSYVIMFAAILPAAAPLTLLYTLAKIKQVCCRYDWCVHSRVAWAAKESPLSWTFSSFSATKGGGVTEHCLVNLASSPSAATAAVSPIVAVAAAMSLQDCMSLLLVYRRPMPRQMRELGSWNTVLQVQVCAVVVKLAVNLAVTWRSSQWLVLFMQLQQHTGFCPQTVCMCIT
jgi:hypothetical protein